MASEAKTGNPIVETVKTIVFALLIAGVFRTLFFQPFWIPSGPIMDTRPIVHFLFVYMTAHGYSFPSCPSVRFAALNINSKDTCGFLGGEHERVFGSESERGDIALFRLPV